MMINLLGQRLYLKTSFLIYLRILTEKKHPQIISGAYREYEHVHLGRWYIKS